MPLDRWASPDRPPSVIYGRDPEVITPLLQLYAPGLPEPSILDCTFAGGVMWRGMPVKPVERTDIDASLSNLTRVCDFRALPPAWTACFDVVVFDPPHRSEAGKTARNRERYGLGVDAVAHTADVTHLFRPFLLEAQRVLVPNGIVLAKMANMNHRGVMRWQCDALRRTAQELGMYPAFSITKVDPSHGERTFKGRVLNGKQVHSEWIVIRNVRRRKIRRAA